MCLFETRYFQSWLKNNIIFNYLLYILPLVITQPSARTVLVSQYFGLFYKTRVFCPPSWLLYCCVLIVREKGKKIIVLISFVARPSKYQSWMLRINFDSSIALRPQFLLREACPILIMIKFSSGISKLKFLYTNRWINLSFIKKINSASLLSFKLKYLKTAG